jgi:predicted deacylase
MGTPLWPDASDLVAQLGSKVTLLAKKSGGDPFDEACSKIWWELAEKFPNYPIPNACLSATVELRGRLDVSHEYGIRDAKNIYNFLVRRGYIKGKAPALPKVHRAATPLSGVEHLKTDSAGIVVFKKRIGEAVKKGDVIAEIVNPIANSPMDRVKKVKCQVDGILFTTIVDRYAKPNRLIAKIAGKKPLKEKGKHLLTAR